jgi:CRISPR-associated Cas5-like protein
MSSGIAYLALLLDGPLQAWGISSQFERRTTSLFPSKSGITGLICAALGLARGSGAEANATQTIAAAEMLSITLPKFRPMQRLQDFHTVLNTRRASNKPNEDAVPTRREYLLDARFAIILRLPAEFARSAAAALENPVWGHMARPKKLYSQRTGLPRHIRKRNCCRPPPGGRHSAKRVHYSSGRAQFRSSYRRAARPTGVLWRNFE